MLQKSSVRNYVAFFFQDDIPIPVQVQVQVQVSKPGSKVFKVPYSIFTHVNKDATLRSDGNYFFTRI